LNAPSARGKKAEPDLDGAATLQYLDHVRRVTERVYGRKHSGSLALHPALYCYDARGKFVAKAFIGAIEFVRDLEQQNKFFEFTEHRKSFENFLIKHPHLMTQIGKSQGSGGRRGVSAVKALYNSLFKSLKARKSEANIIAAMKADADLNFLNWGISEDPHGGDKFDSSDKAAAVIKLALEKDICPECGGRLYIKDKADKIHDRH
jgi:hypothetical protein